MPRLAQILAGKNPTSAAGEINPATIDIHRESIGSLAGARASATTVVAPKRFLMDGVNVTLLV